MTSNFWKGLFENLGTRLNFSSAYHPQTDGQSEIANLTVLDLLKAYVTEVDQRSQWEKYLPLVEYAYNNTVHTSTGKAPFEVIEGRSKSPLLLKVHGKIFAADEYSRDLKESFQKIKEAISIAQQKQKAAANKHRRALAFKENDWVLLKFPKARLRQTTGKNPTGHQKYYAKLAKRYYGPFQILKPINEMAYQLKLPNHWLIHNAFHVSLLKPYKGEPPREAIIEDPPEVEGQEEVLQPESVLRHEDKVLRNGKIIRRYLIKFKNYPFEDAKWMQGTQLKDSLHLVNAYNDSLELKELKASLQQKRKTLLRAEGSNAVVKWIKDEIEHNEVQLAKLKQENPFNDEDIKEVEDDLGASRRMLRRLGNNEETLKLEKDVHLQRAEYDVLEATWREAQGRVLFVKQMIADVQHGKKIMLYPRPQVVDLGEMIHVFRMDHCAKPGCNMVIPEVVKSWVGGHHGVKKEEDAAAAGPGGKNGQAVKDGPNATKSIASHA
ncbi:hypothetical protein L7F22_011928 [Adiantum nelumboides]|nr:hypothetical protein [Adiantum nelumboides]